MDIFDVKVFCFLLIEEVMCLIHILSYNCRKEHFIFFTLTPILCATLREKHKQFSFLVQYKYHDQLQLLCLELT